MTFHLNGKPVDALAMIVHKSVAHDVGKRWVRKLKEVIPRTLFEIAVQAMVGGKVVARETLSAMRKGQISKIAINMVHADRVPLQM